MDKIKFQVIKFEDLKSFKVELFLNDKKVQYNILNLTDLLSAREVNFAEFDLYTCSCGVSGCAGFNEPIKQYKSKTEVKWLMSDDYVMEKKLYVFDIKEFNEVLGCLYSEIIALYENDYSEDHILNEDDNYFNSRKSIKKIIKKVTSVFKRKSEFLDFCNKELPFFNTLTINYNGFSEKVSKTDLVCMIINEWPSHYNKTTKDEYLNLAKEVCDAINNWVLNKDIQKVKEIDKKSYAGIYDEDLELNFLRRFTFKDNNGNRLFLLDENEVIVYNQKENKDESKGKLREDYLTIEY